MPGVDEPAGGRGLRDLVEIRVRQHGDGAVRPELERELLVATCAIRRPTAAEPVNEILRTRSSAQSASPSSPPGPVIVWSAMRRQAGLEQQLRQLQRGQRRLRGRLACCVAGGERRRDLVRHQQQRVVERRDGDDDAHGWRA